MRTSRPVSTVSYNTSKFLKSTLDRLVKERVLSFYAYIYHYAEKDEAKDHYHILMVPAKPVDTLVLAEEFVELSEIPDKPLKCMPIRTSKFDDWFLYVTHNKAYLLKKMQARQYHYTQDDVISFDPDYLNELVHTIDYSKLSYIDIIIDSIKKEEFFDDFALNNYIPVQQFAGYKLMYETLARGFWRANRKTHSPKEIPDGASVAEFHSDVDNPFK